MGKSTETKAKSCRHCGEEDHRSRECPNREPVAEDEPKHEVKEHKSSQKYSEEQHEDQQYDDNEYAGETNEHEGDDDAQGQE